MRKRGDKTIEISSAAFTRLIEHAAIIGFENLDDAIEYAFELLAERALIRLRQQHVVIFNPDMSFAYEAQPPEIVRTKRPVPANIHPVSIPQGAELRRAISRLDPDRRSAARVAALDGRKI